MFNQLIRVHSKCENAKCKMQNAKCEIKRKMPIKLKLHEFLPKKYIFDKEYAFLKLLHDLCYFKNAILENIVFLLEQRQFLLTRGVSHIKTIGCERKTLKNDGCQ